MTKRMCISFCVIFVLVFTLSTTASASNDSLEIGDYPENQKQNLWNGLKLTLLTAEPIREPITCYDINTDGSVVIALRTSPNTICVYDENGRFLYGYSFECYGSYLATWYKGNVMLLLYRGEAAISIDPMGECIDIYKIDFSSHQNKPYIDRIVSGKKQRDSTIFQLSPENIISHDYAKLEMINADGEKIIFYDASSEYSIDVVIRCSLVIILSFAILHLILSRIKVGNK